MLRPHTSIVALHPFSHHQRQSLDDSMLPSPPRMPPPPVPQHQPIPSLQIASPQPQLQRGPSVQIHSPSSGGQSFSPSITPPARYASIRSTLAPASPVSSVNTYL